MAIIWAVVANGTFAQVFEIKGRGREIKAIKEFENPQGRMKISEITSDKPGRSFNRVGANRHALTKEIDPHIHIEKVFVKKIVDFINKEYDTNNFDEIMLLAPAHLVGEINQILPETLRKIVTKEVHKDIHYLEGKERIDQICNLLDLWNHK